MTTGERIKKRRLQLGLTVPETADQLGVSVATMYRYEKGEIEKLPSTLHKKIANTNPGASISATAHLTHAPSAPPAQTKADSARNFPIPRGRFFEKSAFNAEVRKQQPSDVPAFHVRIHRVLFQ